LIKEDNNEKETMNINNLTETEKSILIYVNYNLFNGKSYYRKIERSNQ